MADAQRRAPVQGNRRIALGQPGRCAGTVTWAEHERAWEAYARTYGRGQSAERMAERWGFCYLELTGYLGHVPTTWEPVANG